MKFKFEKQYELEYYFLSLLHQYNKNREIYYEKFEDIIKYYKEKLSQLNSKYYMIDNMENFSINDQISSHKIFFGDVLGKEQFCSITWSVETAKKLIARKNLQSKKLVTSSLMNIMQFYKNDLDINALEQSKKNKEPVIIANYEIVQDPYFVIDGKHRLVSRIQNGFQTIDAIVLEPEDHIECMTGSLYQTLYKVNSNIVNMVSYMDGKQSLKETNQKLIAL